MLSFLPKLTLFQPCHNLSRSAFADFIQLCKPIFSKRSKTLEERDTEFFLYVRPKISSASPENDNSIPKLLRENPKISCVIGLSTEPERLADIRKNRMNSLKETENKSYTDLEKIKVEVEEAKKTFKKYKWPLIDVTRKSVEETAASVIKIYEIYKQNV